MPESDPNQAAPPPPPEFRGDAEATYSPGRGCAPEFDPGAESVSLATQAVWRHGSARDLKEEEASPEESSSFPPMFQLRRQIGRGGFGEVWEALQVALNRVVAVKRLREEVYADDVPGSVDSFARAEEFRQEALTAARLDHPNIVPVHDLGLDEHGRPMMAMKMVRGEPWSKMLRSEFATLPPEEFLARHLPILSTVSQAVAFAHSRGIVHRDIKPGQVMVGQFGEVYLMDWGLALVFDQRVLEESCEGVSPSLAPTTLTAASPAGSPSYMAPEQTEKSAARVGPWTDIYLLGGTLYFLLAGRAPHADPDARTAFFQARSGAVLPPEMAAPGRHIPLDLSALAMWALRHDPKTRVPTAEEFHRRIQDYLTGASKRRESREIVRAVAEKRRRVGGDYAELSECDSMLMRAIGLWPDNPEVRALHERILEDFAAAALQHGDLVLARVQARRLSDRKLRESLLEDIHARESKAQRHVRQRKLFLSAALKARRSALSRQKEAEGARARAEDLMNFMLTDLKRGLHPIGRLELLDQVAQKAQAYFESLPEEESSAGARRDRGRAIANVADVLMARGKLPEAFDAYRRANSLAQRLLADFPSEPSHALDVDGTHNNMGVALLRQGKLEDASAQFKASIAILSGLVAAQPGSALYRKHLADRHNNLGVALSALGRAAEALDTLRQCNRLLREVAEQEPGNPVWWQSVARSYNNLAATLQSAGRLDEALPEFAACRDVFEQLCARDPENAELLADLSSAHNNIAVAQFLQGNPPAALDGHRAALRIKRPLAEADPTNTNLAASVASYETSVGEVLLATGDARGAMDSLSSALCRYDDLAERNPADANVRVQRAWNRLCVGRAKAALGDASGAHEDWEEAVRLLEAGARPAEYSLRLDTLSKALYLLGRWEEARPHAAELKARGHRDGFFLEVCADMGVG